MTDEKKGFRIESIMIYLMIIGIVVAVAMAIPVKNGYRRGIAGIRDPIQGPAEGMIRIRDNGCDLFLTLMNSYDIEGLVVHTRDYVRSTAEDMLSPSDIGLVWGVMAEKNGMIDFHWSHGDRVLNMSYTPEDAVLVGGVKEIDTHVSNNHVIPADLSVLWQIRRIHPGDHVRLQGYLVYVDGKDRNGCPFYWHSSLVRDDTGNGACEVMYVTSVEWL